MLKAHVRHTPVLLLAALFAYFGVRITTSGSEHTKVPLRVVTHNTQSSVRGAAATTKLEPEHEACLSSLLERAQQSRIPKEKAENDASSGQYCEEQRS